METIVIKAPELKYFDVSDVTISKDSDVSVVSALSVRLNTAAGRQFLRYAAGSELFDDRPLKRSWASLDSDYKPEQHDVDLANRKSVVAISAMRYDLVNQNYSLDVVKMEVEGSEHKELFEPILAEYILLKSYVEALHDAIQIYFEYLKASGLFTPSTFCDFLKEKSEFVFGEGSTQHVGRVFDASVRHTMFGSFIQIRYTLLTARANGIYRGRCTAKIGLWNGLAKVEDVAIKQLTAEQKEYFIARGKKYFGLAEKAGYVAAAGLIVRKSWYGEKSRRNEGRVVVDEMSMRKMDSNYNFYFANEDASLVEAKFNPDEMSDDLLINHSPFVYGFSFAAKVWGEMELESISDIKFREDAYDALIMDPKRKAILTSLVANSTIADADVIEGKGGGLIFLLHGSPGVGKTLTAEVIAEKLKRPLYMVGVGELGVTPNELEENLTNVLEVAEAWNAVLLLDEADIFLEARSAHDIQRNAMVGIFLRLLEYYQGILFLTTNRAKEIDKAMASRISMGLYYPALPVDSRAQIWSNLIARQGGDPSTIDIASLSGIEINGRQVKNMVRIGMACAAMENRPAVTADFKDVIDMADEFNVMMNGSELGAIEK